MLKENSISIIIEIPAVKHTFSCIVSESITFSVLFELIKTRVLQEDSYVLDEQTLVFEKRNFQMCDKNMTFRALKVNNDYWFLVY